MAHARRGALTPRPAAGAARMALLRHDGETASVELATMLAARVSQAQLCADALPDKVGGLAPAPTAEASRLLVAVVTCEADGSVGRNVRKLVRELKARARQQRCHNPGAAELVATEGSELSGLRCAVIALGRAKCSNSAASTKDTVYASGRLLRQLLESAAGATVDAPPSPGPRSAVQTSLPASSINLLIDLAVAACRSVLFF